ncbi:tRNA (adenosine(37)-N6)-threonylcarbamoyltransferase complex transferase subunit TsaD [Candidatus Wolfebacteria bacterium]|nr:tRNA (adenosine(37)-N6)-threonylcarbamoyltransferase complex transferase subunit TsaD [Candidatus Wolfebacteria bacterium]
MRVLAIETSCDETAIALLEASGGLKNPRFKILENFVSSQIAIHRPFGGVVPMLAKREHQKNLPLLWRKIMDHESGIRQKNKPIIPNAKFLIPDLIAVTVGPGLEPALWTGIEFAKQIHQQLTTNKQRRKESKLVGVNHMEGHLYSFLLPSKLTTNYQLLTTKLFPAVALIVSGGHTTLLLLKNLTTYKKLGETRDDAAGECFDKVARLLGLPYPGGPEIEKIAQAGDPCAIPFPRPMLHQKNYDFSFAGLKTAVLYYLREHPLKDNSSRFKADVAASFEQAVFDVLIAKTMRAVREHKAKSVILCGGVSASKTLRASFKKAVREKKGTRLVVPDFRFSTDNAAMIGAVGYITLMKNGKDLPLLANGTMEI